MDAGVTSLFPTADEPGQENQEESRGESVNQLWPEGRRQDLADKVVSLNPHHVDFLEDMLKDSWVL